MHEQIVEVVAGFLANIPTPWATAIMAMLPITELRASIPYAIFKYGHTVEEAYLYSVLGNIVPIVLILLLLKKIDAFLRQRSVTARRFFDWLYERTYKKDGKHFERWGTIALIVIAALPFPVITGAWTAALLATIFDVPFKKSATAITIGILLAGVIVVGLTVGVKGLVAAN